MIDSTILNKFSPEDVVPAVGTSHPIRIELLSRGSEHGSKAQTFHDKWDGIGNTLTLVRTEDGRTVGGSSKYIWDQVAEDYVTDTGMPAFLLQFGLREKLSPVNGDHLICGCQDNAVLLLAVMVAIFISLASTRSSGPFASSSEH